jgi:hypothetical protein
MPCQPQLTEKHQREAGDAPLSGQIPITWHSEYSTTLDPSRVLSQEVVLRPPENTRSDSVDIGGIEKMLIANFDKDRKLVCCDSRSYHVSGLELPIDMGSAFIFIKEKVSLWMYKEGK